MARRLEVTSQRHPPRLPLLKTVLLDQFTWSLWSSLKIFLPMNFRSCASTTPILLRQRKRCDGMYHGMYHSVTSGQDFSKTDVIVSRSLDIAA